MPVQEFYKLSPIEFYYALNEKTLLLKNEIQTQYEIARWQIVHHWNMQGKVLKQSFNSPIEAMPFPWEEAVKVDGGQSIEEMKRQLQMIASTHNRKKK